MAAHITEVVDAGIVDEKTTLLADGTKKTVITKEQIIYKEVEGSQCSIDFFVLVAGAMQILFLLGFIFLTNYDTHPNMGSRTENGNGIDNGNYVIGLNSHFVFFVFVVMWVIIGQGYLMTFLMRGGLSAVGFTFIIVVLATQTHIFAEGLCKMAYEKKFKYIALDIRVFTDAMWAASSCLITFGALLGKAGMNCLAPLCFLQTIFYAINRQLIMHDIAFQDAGGTVVIHMFGCYFALAASFILGVPPKEQIEKFEKASRHSDVFSLLGTLFLWILWPAFNAMKTPMNSEMQERTILNTIVCMTTGCLWTYVMTKALNRRRKFSPKDVQHATLAAGVMLGISATYMIKPEGAAAIGMIAATISVFGYNIVHQKIAPGVHDTCGVHNLHGLPAVAGAIANIVLCWMCNKKDYSPLDYTFSFPKGDDQWWVQLCGTVITFVYALATGALSMTIAMSMLQDTHGSKFKDLEYWDIETYDELADEVQYLENRATQ